MALLDAFLIAVVFLVIGGLLYKHLTWRKSK
jgi:hypothetical protein